MKKLTPWAEVRTQLDPEVVRKADEAFAEEYVAYTLAQLRRSRGLSQMEMSRLLNKTQASISKLENTTSAAVLLSTIMDYVTAMGAKLDLRVTFDDGNSYPLIQGYPTQDTPGPDPKRTPAT